MDDLKKDLLQLEAEVQKAMSQLQIAKKATDLESLQKISSTPDFWQNSEIATEHMQKQSRLESEIQPWLSLQKNLKDTIEIVELNDKELKNEITKQLNELSQTFKSLQLELRFSGVHDTKDALLSIHAGAGGTDAQDWASMLMRMYLRWAESAGLKASIINESAGDEAGIKSVDIEVVGKFAYGKLKSEHGVHRLVRLSPFNADAKRQTSFAKVEVLPKINAPQELPLDENELKIDVFRAGGHGGQSVNTTDSAVRVTHLPTGIVVSIQNERSQIQNKETALTILRSKLAQLQAEQHLDDLAKLKGPNLSAEWGNQIRSYVLHPYNMVKDLRTGHETTDTAAVLNGKIDQFINSYLESVF